MRHGVDATSKHCEKMFIYTLKGGGSKKNKTNKDLAFNQEQAYIKFIIKLYYIIDGYIDIADATRLYHEVYQAKHPLLLKSSARRLYSNIKNENVNCPFIGWVMEKDCWLIFYQQALRDKFLEHIKRFMPCSKDGRYMDFQKFPLAEFKFDSYDDLKFFSLEARLEREFYRNNLHRERYTSQNLRSFMAYAFNGDLINWIK